VLLVREFKSPPLTRCLRETGLTSAKVVSAQAFLASCGESRHQRDHGQGGGRGPQRLVGMMLWGLGKGLKCEIQIRKISGYL
jgi:hypothetical protein